MPRSFSHRTCSVQVSRLATNRLRSMPYWALAGPRTGLGVFARLLLTKPFPVGFVDNIYIYILALDAYLSWLLLKNLLMLLATSNHKCRPLRCQARQCPLKSHPDLRSQCLASTLQYASMTSTSSSR